MGGKQAIRQRARQAARETALRRRHEREQRERRLRALAEQVLVAVAERDQAVVESERRAGAALCEFTEGEGLTLREAVEWCDEAISVREATRLRRIAGERDRSLAPLPEARSEEAPGRATEAIG